MKRTLFFGGLVVVLALFALNLVYGESAALAEEPTLDIARLVADMSPPEVQTFELMPEVVDTSQVEQTLVITTSVADVGTGVDGNGGLQVQFRSPSGHQLLDFTFYHGIAGQPDALIECVGPLCLWRSEATLPKHSESGEWRLEYFFMIDKAGNSKILSYNDMIAEPFPASFEVNNTYQVYVPLVIER
jgi:hypothetical protein